MRARASPSAGSAGAGRARTCRALRPDRRRSERDFTPAWSHEYDAGAMPEANVLYSVTAAVIVGLVVWVAFVLKTAKEPWARPPVASLRTEDVPVEGSAVAPVEVEAKAEAGEEAKADAKEEPDADADAKAEAKAEVAEEADAEAEAEREGRRSAK